MNLEHVITIKTGGIDQFNIKGFGFPAQLKGLEKEICNHINQLGQGIQKVQKQGLDELGKQSQKLQQAQLRANNSIMTGNLLNSIHQQKGGDSVHIGTNVFYAKYVEEGRGPIVARGKALHFFTKSGNEVFAKRVGPARAKPYLAPSGEILPSYFSIIDKLLGGISW
ncbi:HK97 gp10 family phage protein [Methanosphaera cuniculi]|uniref:Uncharacterized protein n=1 Tax=Methanosphaera cuniculi TaxID=1077256 RepID=A0A2A2HFT8_9EURY|nr:HK97 gp10 family phage protein [Methanosphaera cuniculi]PAV08103.1 hypothetical protein ASJ82_01160 [Methanosphaera cuniculi]PWL07739.1 hypothetical protein MSCUN_12700 [Methanosphaera cuniculi]